MTYIRTCNRLLSLEVNSYQQRPPTHTGNQHDGQKLDDHLQVVRGASAAMPPPQLGLQQGAAGQGVAHHREQQRQQTQHGEDQRQQHVQPVPGLLLAEEAPAAGVLHLVGPPQDERQAGHQGGQHPGEPQQALHVTGSHGRGVEEGPGDPDAALHRHGAAEEQRAEAEEHQGRPEEAAQDAVGVKRLPPLVGAVDEEHQGAVDQVSQEVGDHQPAGKQHEGGLGLEADAVVGFDQDEESQAVGEDPAGHGDNGCRDRRVIGAAGGVGCPDSCPAPAL